MAPTTRPAPRIASEAAVRRQARRRAEMGQDPPLPTERSELKLLVSRKRVVWGETRRNGGGLIQRVLAFVQWLMAKLNAFRPMRVWQHYNLQHGPLLSAGIGYNMFFSITGLLTTGFSIAGLVLAQQPELLNSVVKSVASSAPGLLKVDGSDGLVNPQDLMNPSGLGWTAVIAAVITLFTSLGWIASLRDGLRGVNMLRPLQLNPVVMKLKDAGTLVLLGVVLVLSAGVSLVFGTAAGWVMGFLHLDPAIAQPITWLVRIAVPLLLAWATAAIMFRLAGSLPLDRRAFLEGTAIAAVGTTILQIFSTQLLAQAGKNPLLASFAIVIGLMIWFNLVSQVYLLSASWAAIRNNDAQAQRELSEKNSAVAGSRPVQALRLNHHLEHQKALSGAPAARESRITQRPAALPQPEHRDRWTWTEFFGTLGKRKK
ncbi:YihY/virulence factor BrkB family protein [Pseudarthrobacter sp. J1763]|uniref:YihY/virulence factor BrkB family protein n=1 Tax=Pseudarthrobacter sp. J1763 TaxID=3420445 RepID=UPI003D2660E3